MTARDRSRSPHTLDNTEEIIRLVATREQARLQKDWALADTLRTQLSTMGVTLFDKTASWRTADGKSGRIPTFNELDGGNLERVIVQQALEIQSQQTPAALLGSMGAVASFSIDAESQIKALIQQREQARANKDFTRSDQIREELKTMGVEVFDKEKMWRSTSGASGVILGFHTRGGPTDLEITTLVVQREKVRQSADFGTSDMIRNELRAVGVEIYDKEKVWKASDGRQGPVPTWQQVQAVCSTGGAVAAAAAPPAMMGAMGSMTAMGGMPAMQSMSMMAGVAGGTTFLQQQVIQAALAAAQTPESAAQTLQLLQGSRGGGVVAPKGAMTRSEPGAGAASPAYQQAMQIMSECASSGRQAQDAEILFLISVREKLRYKKDFQAADDLRNAMRNSLNVELYEKEKRWATTDGRQGIIPMFNDLAQM